MCLKLVLNTKSHVAVFYRNIPVIFQYYFTVIYRNLPVSYGNITMTSNPTCNIYKFNQGKRVEWDI